MLRSTSSNRRRERTTPSDRTMSVDVAIDFAHDQLCLPAVNATAAAWDLRSAKYIYSTFAKGRA